MTVRQRCRVAFSLEILLMCKSDQVNLGTTDSLDFLLTHHLAAKFSLGVGLIRTLIFRQTRRLQGNLLISLSALLLPPTLFASPAMGNCFGKTKDSDNFKGQGRTLGGPTPANAPAAASTAAKVPAGASSGQGRTLGGPQGDVNDPKSAAFRAAEVSYLSSPPRARPMAATAYL